MRVVAQAIDAKTPAIFAVHGIEEGDALALATRFARDYVYRGRQALFWNATFTAREVLDRYRGLLRVDGTFAGGRLALVAARFASDRAQRVHELRRARSVLRGTKSPVLLFVSGVVEGEVGFADLGFATLTSGGGAMIAAREAGARASIVTV